MHSGHSAVIKKDMVRLMCAADAKPLPPAPQPGGAATGKARAQVVQLDQQTAMIEVTCACGARVLLQCEFADISQPAPAAGTDNPSR